MIELEGMHHISLAIKNLEKAKYFYGEILGFPELERPGFSFPGAWYQVGDQQLHLIENTEAHTLRPTKKIDTRDGHFAIRVKDYQQTLDYLKEKNIDVFENTSSKSGFIQLFCCDPDGNLIEFNVDKPE